MIKISLQKQLNMAQGSKMFTADIEIKSGEFVVIFGKSGTGKTSLLRMIAGLMKPDQGHIAVDNVVWFDARNKVHLPIQKRNIGFVFQDLALFPNMSVMDNLIFAAGKNKDEAYLDRLLLMTEMKALSARMPQTLSGGQQQRVALMRALARKPGLLLLDEPFSSLDEQMGYQLRKELRSLHQQLHLTTILVSHDLIDINGNADKVVEIENGRTIPMKTIACRYSGKIKRIYAYGSGFMAEIALDNEILKMPIDELTASKLKEGSTLSIAYGNGHVHIFPHF
ncbi:ATP-binding cassette domain-containing protein [Arachidicoccus terrestris]|uniref:ATP-binding cassette domain-containing protein n=1 Tax=Arachidicoccus terrestris TaxID=2875539 RepID=UPI001CC4FE3C|nr:ATP-binding cassette domain-containing protein [Arachidicoccus terrestris]UAY54344.1 ATP-binding cassette domain-containing protein [Arachidicoccus terrestris]